MTELISIPKELNYVAAFLTLSCNFRCNYCINRPGTTSCRPRGLRSAAEWAGFLNRLALPDDLPISLQGGEPSLHPEFFELIKSIREDLHVDILTNLSFDVRRFASEIPAARFHRKAPYAAIRVTYHPGQSNLDDLLEKVSYLKDRDYPVGLYSIRVPGHEELIEKVREKARVRGIDFRTKEFLGLAKKKVCGTYHYEDGVFADQLKSCYCRTTELLMAPDGSVYRCHRDLYQAEFAVGHILDPSFAPRFVFRACDKFGECNPCDLKRKTNRFQIEGHASVEVRFDRPQAHEIAVDDSDRPVPELAHG